VKTETPTRVVAMPDYLARFRHEEWAPLVGPEPENWGGRRLGDSWVHFRAHGMYLQALSEWRRTHSRGSE